MRNIPSWDLLAPLNSRALRDLALKSIFDIYTKEMYSLPVAGFSGIFRGIYFKRNNFINAPRTHVRDANGYSAWVYYFEDGQDNWHFPENRAECCKSESFLGGG